MASLAVKHLQHLPLYSVISHFVRMNANQESGKFYSDLRNTSSLELTQYYCVNCHCIAVTVPIKLNSCVSWSASETVASVHLPSSSVLAEVLGHIILWRQCSCFIAMQLPCSDMHTSAAYCDPSGNTDLLVLGS